MRGRMLIRMLMMFGPMIMRQFKKYQSQKSRDVPRQNREEAPQKYDDVTPEYQENARSEYREEPLETQREYKKDEFV